MLLYKNSYINIQSFTIAFSTQIINPWNIQETILIKDTQIRHTFQMLNFLSHINVGKKSKMK